MAKDVTITIEMGDDGKPTVSWDSADDCTQGNAKQPCGYRKKKVIWGPAGGVKDRVWAVIFTEGSPFHKKQAVFSPSSPEGKVKDDAPLESYKYWVALADAGGDLQWRDPRIMISEPSPAPGDPTYLMMASELEEFARTSEELADQAREVADGLRSLSPSDDPPSTAA